MDNILVIFPHNTSACSTYKCPFHLCPSMPTLFFKAFLCWCSHFNHENVPFTAWYKMGVPTGGVYFCSYIVNPVSIVRIAHSKWLRTFEGGRPFPPLESNYTHFPGITIQPQLFRPDRTCQWQIRPVFIPVNHTAGAGDDMEQDDESVLPFRHSHGPISTVSEQVASSPSPSAYDEDIVDHQVVLPAVSQSSANRLSLSNPYPKRKREERSPHVAAIYYSPGSDTISIPQAPDYLRLS
jgi:hypothetical protein